jgi:hypothetical protein
MLMTAQTFCTEIFAVIISVCVKCHQVFQQSRLHLLPRWKLNTHNHTIIPNDT